MLILAGAFVEAGVVVHRPSRAILHAWARSELASAAGFRTFLLGLAHGRSGAEAPCPLTALDVAGLPQRVASYLQRRTPRELRHVGRAVWVWDDEVEDEAFRSETRAFPRQSHCIECF